MAGDIAFSILHIIVLVISKTAIIWAPLLLGRIAFFLWHHFVSDRFIGGIEWTLLEIELPREVDRTPLAMELFFTNAMYHMSNKGVWEVYWQGAVHFWFSLEIISIDGRVRFFIRTPSRLKKLIETQLYAQYPQVRVTEAEDYTLAIPRYTNNGNWNLWGSEYKLHEHDALPLKTYVDYGLDKAGEEEKFKIDPMTPMIEFLGALERGEQVWVQLIIRPSEKKYHSSLHHGHHIGFHDAAWEYMEEKLAPYKRAQKNDDATASLSFDARVPEYMKDMVKDIKEKSEKVPFDCGIRVMVLADKRLVSQDTFNNTRRASRLLFRQFSDMDTNRLERFNSTQFDYPFSDPLGTFIEKMKGRMLTFYKLRTMYYPPLLFSFKYPKFMNAFFPSGKPEYFVLSTEELASIYHFPGLVSETPSFQRLDTKTSKPPANLPM